MMMIKMICCQVVDKWIKDIEDLHRSQPAPTIQYTKTMPEIDQLMQVTSHTLYNIYRTNIDSFRHSVTTFDVDMTNIIY